MKAKPYPSLGVRLEYDHVLMRIRATAEAACVPDVPGGGLELMFCYPHPDTFTG
jgi:hypothetical protein